MEQEYLLSICVIKWKKDYFFQSDLIKRKLQKDI